MKSCPLSVLFRSQELRERLGFEISGCNGYTDKVHWNRLPNAGGFLKGWPRPR